MSNERMTVNYNEDGLEALATAIAWQAASDYQEELAKSKEMGIKTRGLKELDEFFDSDYGRLITLDQGDTIRELIRNGMAVEVKYNRNALTEEDCEYIRTHYKRGKGKGKCPLRALADKFGVSIGTVRRVVIGGYKNVG